MIKVNQDEIEGLIKVTGDHPDATHFTCIPDSSNGDNEWDTITYYKEPSLLTHIYTEREVLDILREVYIEHGSTSMLETMGRAMNREITSSDLYV